MIEVPREILEKVVQSIKEGILLIGRDYKIHWANQAALDQTGYQLEEIVGKYCYEITHHRTSPCQPPDDICPITEISKKGESTTEVHAHYGPAGEKVFSEVTAYPVLYEKERCGNIVEFVHVTRDITERKRAEEKLEKHTEEIERLNKFMVGRELNMVELKKEINALLKELGRESKYL